MKKTSWETVFSKKGSKKIIFQKKDIHKVLDLTNNTIKSQTKEIINEDGSTVKAFSKSRFSDEDPVTSKNLGAVITGSKVFLKNNMSSAYDYLKNSK